jgi:PAS domain S-box-containing protein
MAIELNRTIDALPALMWTAFPDGRPEYFNQRWCEYAGLSVEESLAGGWLQVVHPDDRAKALAAWQSCLDSGNAGGTEVRVRRHDGDYRCFLLQMSPVYGEGGNITKWCGLETDIEDHKRAEATVSVEVCFRLVMDTLPVPMLLLTPDGEVLHANRETLEGTGVTLSEAVNWKNRVHPDDGHMIGAVQAAMDSGKSFDIDWRYRVASGYYRWIRTRGTPLPHDDGRPSLWCCHITDINERRRAEILVTGEKRVLEMVARSVPLHAVLDALCQLGEEIDSSCHCGVLLIDPVSKTLQRGGASSGTSAYIDAMQGLPAAPTFGPSSEAAASASQVIVEDIASDPRSWSQRWPDMTPAPGLRACWCTPILSRNREALGAFAIYRSEPGTPSPFQLELIEQLTYTASIAIERAQSDMALRRSMEEFRAIVETTPECVTLVAIDGTVLQVNSAGACMAGVHGADDLVGKCFFDFVAFEHRQRYIEYHQKVCAGKKVRLEFDICTERGERRRLESYSAPMELTNGAVAQLGVARDITARRLAETELRKQEVLMAKSQQISLSGSFSWRPESRETVWSEQACRIFGFELGVPITMDMVAARIHPEDLHFLISDVVERAQLGQDLKYEHRLQLPDGTIKYLYMQAHATRDEQGRLEYIGAMRDVTEHQQSEEALNRLRTELAHVTRTNSLSALTACIAHEINQPLAGIMTNASTGFRMLSADPPNVEGALQTVRRTLRDGRRASDVVTHLRALFSKKVVSNEQLDLGEATSEVVELLRSAIRRKRVVLQQHCAEDLPPVTGDRVQLQQVVLNLMLNAIEAMQDVEDRPRELQIKIERDADNSVRLSVTDSGSGFDPQHAEKMFDSFYTTKGNGMGLGLSVSRSIIEVHGGRMWAKSNDGPGATFSFSIPCQSSCTAVSDSLDAELLSAETSAVSTGVPP